MYINISINLTNIFCAHQTGKNESIYILIAAGEKNTNKTVTLENILAMGRKVEDEHTL